MKRSSLQYIVIATILFALNVFGLFALNVFGQSETKITFQGKMMTVSEYVSNPAAFKQWRDKWLGMTDPKTRLSPAEHEKLWGENIVISMRFAPEKIRLDAFGMGATPAIHKSLPRLCESMMETVNDEVIHNALEYKEIVSLLLKLKSRVDAEFRKKSKRDEFVPTVFRCELSQQTSSIRNTAECWLVIDVYPATKKVEGLLEADFKSIHLNGHIDGVIPNDLGTTITFVEPDPRIKESKLWWKNLPPLKPNRQEPRVVVHDDGLSRQERESQNGFSFADNTGLKSHQVEGVGWGGSQLDERTEDALSTAASLISDRLPKGSVVSPDELHLRVGKAANVLSRRFPKHILDIKVELRPFGDKNFSEIRLELTAREDSPN
jgi:hypothetical protein